MLNRSCNADAGRAEAAGRGEVSSLGLGCFGRPCGYEAIDSTPKYFPSFICQGLKQDDVADKAYPMPCPVGMAARWRNKRRGLTKSFVPSQVPGTEQCSTTSQATSQQQQVTTKTTNNDDVKERKNKKHLAILKTVEPDSLNAVRPTEEWALPH